MPSLLAEFFLSLAYCLLDFALDLLGGVSFDRAGNIICFALGLLHLACCYIFTSHAMLLVRMINSYKPDATIWQNNKGTPQAALALAQ
jgi:hypothetical protein